MSSISGVPVKNDSHHSAGSLTDMLISGNSEKGNAQEKVDEAVNEMTNSLTTTAPASQNINFIA